MGCGVLLGARVPGADMTAGPSRAALPQQAAPAAETGQAELIEVTFTPAEPQLTPGAARAVLALLLRARETAQARDRPEGGRT
jgi:hypothetical protein